MHTNIHTTFLIAVNNPVTLFRRLAGLAHPYRSDFSDEASLEYVTVLSDKSCR